ncbi:MAG: NUDIX hydrolase [Thaumarchaeota archaeon]|nr:NUDIX hydrolase [Nitrososphaerota archaeon]MCY3975955.1 NUDIX hydrolase [Nitrososphaerota archaeon]
MYKCKKIISKNNIYSNNIFEINKYKLLLNGETKKIDIVKHNGSVSVLAIDKDHLIMVKQYRASIEKDILEVPAGTIEKNEQPEECAIRELEEETGYKSRNMTHMFSYYSSIGYSTELIRCYVASKLHKTNTQIDCKITNVQKIKFNAIMKMIKNKEITDSKTICAVLFYNQFYN